LWICRIENDRISAFLASNALVEEIEIDLRCTRQILPERLTTSLLDGYIPSHNYIETFNWVRSPFEVSDPQFHCEMDFIAE